MGGNGGWRITLLESDGQRELPCQTDETLLAALRPVHRRRAIAGCRNGGCGICRVRIVEGEYRVGLISRTHVSMEDQAAGYTLACRTTPCSDLVLEIVGIARAGAVGPFRTQ